MNNTVDRESLAGLVLVIGIVLVVMLIVAAIIAALGVAL